MVDSYFLIFPFLGRFNVFYAAVTRNYIDYNAQDSIWLSGWNPANFHYDMYEEKNVPRAPLHFGVRSAKTKSQSGSKRVAICDLLFAF